jgi:ubiquinone/menaquinone biosynthesis C-methylase UbiE
MTQPLPSPDRTPEMLDLIRQQFDFEPYPNNPIDFLPENDLNFLFLHNFATPHYLQKQQVINSAELTILDAGCGSGAKSLGLAIANPGAKIVGVDLSERSVDLARKRLLYHNFTNTEFHAIALEDLPSLGLQFDYINCDEVLYLLPSTTAGLAAMKAVLKPHGFIRGNLHSRYQRRHYYLAQELFQRIGLMEGNPEAMEIDLVTSTWNALKEGVILKQFVWPKPPQAEELTTTVLMNFLLRGDRGFTIPDLFELLAQNDLEFVSMVNWRQWEILDLFKDGDDLPAFWAMSLPEASVEERLALYELLNPRHRLLDFWCGHRMSAAPMLCPSDWSADLWQTATVQLHPLLKASTQFEQRLKQSIQQVTAFPISQLMNITLRDGSTYSIDSAFTSSVLLPLLDGKKSVPELVDRFHQIHPIDPITLQPMPPDICFSKVTQFLSQLETFLYVMLEVPKPDQA